MSPVSSSVIRASLIVRGPRPVSDASARSEALKVFSPFRFAFSQRARYRRLADCPILDAVPLLKNLFGILVNWPISTSGNPPPFTGIPFEVVFKWRFADHCCSQLGRPMPEAEAMKPPPLLV